MSDVKKKRPSRSKYLPIFARQARNLALMGVTEKRIAEEFFEVTQRTLFNWKQLHPEFAVAMEIDKDQIDGSVMSALLKRALGMTIKKTKVVTIGDKQTVTEFTEELPPDFGSMKLWLINRQRDAWKPDSAHGVASETDDAALAEALKKLSGKLPE